MKNNKQSSKREAHIVGLKGIFFLSFKIQLIKLKMPLLMVNDEW